MKAKQKHGFPKHEIPRRENNVLTTRDSSFNSFQSLLIAESPLAHDKIDAVGLFGGGVILAIRLSTLFMSI